MEGETGITSNKSARLELNQGRCSYVTCAVTIGLPGQSMEYHIITVDGFLFLFTHTYTNYIIIITYQSSSVKGPHCQCKGYTEDLGCSWTWTLLRRSQSALQQTGRGWLPTPPPAWAKDRRIRGCVSQTIFVSLFITVRACARQVSSYFLSSLSYCSCVKSKGKQAFTLFSCEANMWNCSASQTLAKRPERRWGIVQI